MCRPTCDVAVVLLICCRACHRQSSGFINSLVVGLIACSKQCRPVASIRRQCWLGQARNSYDLRIEYGGGNREGEERQSSFSFFLRTFLVER